jgi:hypothetical protein
VTDPPGSDPCRAARRRGGARPEGPGGGSTAPEGAAAKVTTRRDRPSARALTGPAVGVANELRFAHSGVCDVCENLALKKPFPSPSHTPSGVRVRTLRPAERRRVASRALAPPLRGCGVLPGGPQRRRRCWSRDQRRQSAARPVRLPRL